MSDPVVQPDAGTHTAAEPRRSTTWAVEWWLILAVVLVTRFYRLGYQSLWFDEAFSWQTACGSLAHLFRQMAYDANHPPLFYLLVRTSWAVQHSEAALRFPSAVSSVGIVLGTMAVGRKLFGERVALLAGWVLACSPFEIYYAQEARMYALYTCMVVIAGFWFLELRRAESRGAWWMYLCCCGAAAWSHFFAVPALAAHGAALAWERRWRLFGRWCVRFGLVTVVLLGPVLLAMIPRSQQIKPGHGELSWASSMLFGVIADFSTGYYEGLHHGGWETWTMLAILISMALWIVGLCEQRRCPGAAALTVPAALFPIAIAFLWAILSYFHQPRYAMAAHPFFALWMALGIWALWRRLPPLAVIAGALLLVLNVVAIRNYYADPVYARADWRAVARYVGADLRPGDVIVFNAGWMDVPFDFYFKRGTGRTYVKVGLPENLQDSPAKIAHDVARTCKRAERAWLLLNYTEITDPKDVVLHEFQRQARQLVFRQFPSIRLYLFRTDHGHRGLQGPPAPAVTP